MKANEPKTYQGLINKKRCYELLKYYDLSQRTFDLILDFMNNNPTGKVECGKAFITLSVNGEFVQYIDAELKNSTVDGIVWEGPKYIVIPHVVYHYSSSGFSSGGGSSDWSSGGGSSNNNNNNNNNNNR